MLNGMKTHKKLMTSNNSQVLRLMGYFVSLYLGTLQLTLVHLRFTLEFMVSFHSTTKSCSNMST